MNLQNTNGVVRGTINVEKQAKAEVENQKNRTDPTERDDLIERNTIVNIPLSDEKQKEDALRQHEEKEQVKRDSGEQTGPKSGE